ncbi:hypothetical protein ACFLT9_02905 [Acidobacteriota bacterium]
MKIRSVARKHADFPQRGKSARFQASLSSRLGGTMPPQPYIRLSMPPTGSSYSTRNELIDRENKVGINV